MPLNPRLVKFIESAHVETTLSDWQKLLLEDLSKPRTRRIMTHIKAQNRTAKSIVLEYIASLCSNFRSSVSGSVQGNSTVSSMMQPTYRRVKPVDFTPKASGSVQGNSQYNSKANKLSRKKRGY